MKYFIYTNHHLEEVESTYYEVWHSLFAHEYMLEDYVYVGRDAVHYLETMYVGALDKDEWDEPLPFVLFYDRDELRITDDGVKKSTLQNEKTLVKSCRLMNIWNCTRFDIVLLLLQAEIKTPSLMMIQILDRLNGEGIKILSGKAAMANTSNKCKYHTRLT